MVLHYLQCAVEPPILPNLYDLFPELFDGNGPVDELKVYELNLRSNLVGCISKNYLEIPKNKRTLGELAYGFFTYYARFRYDYNLISIRHARIESKPYMEQVFSIQEPYSLEIMPLNMTSEKVLTEIIQVFSDARDNLVNNLFEELPQKLAEKLEKQDFT